MPRRRKRITIVCPHCSATYEGFADMTLPEFCTYCNREVEEWIIDDDDYEDYEEEENPDNYLGQEPRLHKKGDPTQIAYDPEIQKSRKVKPGELTKGGVIVARKKNPGTYYDDNGEIEF